VFPAPDSNSSRPAPSPFRRVLVGWDASPDSVTALRAAAAIVGGHDGRVIAFAVVSASPPLEVPEDDGGQLSAEGRHLKRTFDSALASIAATSGAEVGLRTEEGRDVAGIMCAYATEHAFDLLVLGRHGNEGIFHPKLGHVAHAVARTSRIPVLLVSARPSMG
jgi:nucleotide-binding universal stress UspA family protein